LRLEEKVLSTVLYVSADRGSSRLLRGYYVSLIVYTVNVLYKEFAQVDAKEKKHARLLM
jgi:hypothetical protein